MPMCVYVTNKDWCIHVKVYIYIYIYIFCLLCLCMYHCANVLYVVCIGYKYEQHIRRMSNNIVTCVFVFVCIIYIIYKTYNL